MLVLCVVLQEMGLPHGLSALRGVIQDKSLRSIWPYARFTIADLTGTLPSDDDLQWVLSRPYLET